MQRTIIAVAVIGLAACSPPAEKTNNEVDPTNSSTNANTNSGTNQSTNSSTNSSTNNPVNSTNSNLTEELPEFLDWIAAFCAYDASCAFPDYTSAAECETEVQGAIELEDCWLYDHALFEQCVQELDTTCLGEYENYPRACDRYIDDSACCAEQGGVSVIDDDGIMQCRDACTVPDDCGFGFDCTEEGACDCPNKLAEVNGELMCLVECANGECEVGLTCRSGVCVPDL